MKLNPHPPLDNAERIQQYREMTKVREKKILDSSLEKKLAAYTLAAASSLAARGASAQDAIVYTSTDECVEAALPTTIFSDLNHDEISDSELLGSSSHLESSAFKRFLRKSY